jgi:hypothetical protein
VLGLDEGAGAALIELLTDQQMKQLELFNSEALTAQPRTREDLEARARAFTDAETRKNQEVRAQIGEERFARYLDYQQTRMERMQLARFNERLAPADKLTDDQSRG